MLRTLRPALLAALLALLAPGLLFAQAQGRVKVTVVDENGDPVADATVTVSSEEIGYHKVVETDKRGQFALIFVDGTRIYHVVFEKEGYKTVDGDLDPTPGDTVENEFVLPTARSRTAGGATETGPSADPLVEVFNQGVSALHAGDFETAKVKFQRAMEMDPKMVAAPSTLSSIYLEQRDFDQAVAMADKALALDPDDARALRVLYDVCDHRGETARAQKLLERLRTVEGGTETAVRVFNEGAQAAQRGDIETARARFEEALTIDPELAPAYAALANIYLRTEEYDKAIEAAQKAREIDPGDTAVLRYEYEAYRLKGDQAKAQELFAQLSAADPEGTGEALFDRGVQLFNQGDMPAARQAFEQALAVDPDRAKAHYMLGLACANSGDNAKAREHFQRFLELAPDDPDAATAKEMLDYLG